MIVGLGFAVWCIFDVSSAEEWQALATGLAALIGLVAAIAAASQLSEARQLRRERSQPYVAVSLEAVAPLMGTGWAELVIRNHGPTAALEVTLVVEPRPLRYMGPEGGPEEVWLPNPIPTLAPGQEWRTLWDSASKRDEADAPTEHRVEVCFKDSGGAGFELDYALDWEAIYKRATPSIYGAHESAKALRELVRTVNRWSEVGEGAVSVVARDGLVLERRRRKAAKQGVWWDRSSWPRRRRAGSVVARFYRRLRTRVKNALPGSSKP